MFNKIVFTIVYSLLALVVLPPQKYGPYVTKYMYLSQILRYLYLSISILYTLYFYIHFGGLYFSLLPVTVFLHCGIDAYIRVKDLNASTTS